MVIWDLCLVALFFSCFFLVFCFVYFVCFAARSLDSTGGDGKDWLSTCALALAEIGLDLG